MDDVQKGKEYIVNNFCENMAVAKPPKPGEIYGTEM